MTDPTRTDTATGVCGTCEGIGSQPAPEWMLNPDDVRTIAAGADWPEIACGACDGWGEWKEEATR